MATGVGFNFDTSFLDALKRADKQLDVIMQKSKNMSSNLTRDFMSMVKNGVVPFADSLKQQKKVLEEIGNIKITGRNSMFASLQRDAAKTVNEINNVLNILQKTKAYSSETSGRTAMSFANKILGSRGDKSIDNMRKALSQLEAAQGRQNLNTKRGRQNYEKLAQTISRVKLELNKATEESRRFGQENRNLLNTSDQLKRAFTGLFAVSAVRGYVNDLINVRGEFEMQHRSLQILIGDLGEADKLWNKTIALAVKSPFRVKDLVSYTKQLAAYRVESEKLYDVNKMLADVSSGLGVDMQRLILAYGQVKAANYLRGTELRQFSEAGVNMLGELSKLYSEIENRTVTVGDVFERVSKRLVTFEDVHEVFKRITSEGGTFYKMQEKQSETLKGQIMNLRDSIDLMINTIGESNDGVLKGSVAAVRELVENWEDVASALKGIIALFALYRIQAIASSKATIALATRFKVISTKEFPRMLTMNQLLNLSFRRLTLSVRRFNAAMIKSFKGNIWLIALAALTSAIVELATWNDELNEKLKDIYDERNKELSQVKELIREYEKLKKAQATNAEKKDILSKLVDEAKKYKIDIPFEIEELDETKIDKYINELSETIFKSINFGTELGRQVAEGLTAAQGWFHIFGDNLSSDLEQLSKANSSILGGAETIVENYFNQLSASYEDLSDSAKSYYDEIKKGKKETESEQDYLLRKIEYAQKINSLYTKYDKTTGRYMVTSADFSGEIQELETKRLNILLKQKEVYLELDKVIKGIQKAYNVEDFSQLTDSEKRTFKFRIDEEFEKMQLDESTKRMAAHYLANKLKVNIDYIIGGDKLDDWQKKVIAAVEKLGDMSGIRFGGEQVKGKTIEQVQNYVKSLVEAANKTIEKYPIKNQQVYSKEDYENAVKQLPILEKIAAIVGLDLNKKEEKGNKEIERRISLIKEMHEQYLKLRKEYDHAAAMQKVMTDYAESFSTIFDGLSLDFSTIDITTKSGVADFLTSLRPLAKKKGKEALQELEKTIGNFKSESELEILILNREQTERQIENLFSGYEMSIDLSNIGIEGDLAKQLFDVSTISIKDLRDKLNPIIQELRTTSENVLASDSSDEEKKLAENKLKLARDTEEKLNKIESDNLKERAKIYVKYLEESMNERVKIRVEELKKLKELEESTEFTDKQKRDIRKGIQKETQEKLSIEEWKSFKESDIYEYMFEDMDVVGNKVINSLQVKLNDLKETLKGKLPVDQYKEIIKEIEKLEDIKLERNPLESLMKYYEDFETFKKNNEKDISDFSYKGLEASFLSSQETITSLEKENDLIETIIRAKEKGLKIDDESVTSAEDYSSFSEMGLTALYGMRDSNNILISQEQKRAETAKQGMNIQEGIVDSYKAAVDKTKAWGEAFNGVLDGIDAILDAFGVAEDDSSRIWIESTKQIANMAVQVVMLKAAMVELGIEANSALGIIGIIGVALTAVGTMFSAIFQAHDNALDKRIENLSYRVERLQKSYEKLEKAIENAYDAMDVANTEKIAKANIREQIFAYQQMINAEEAKKKNDKKRIQEYYDAISDLREQEKELMQENIESFGGSFDFRSTTREFVDAWIDAFKETGNGLYGLQENFSEFFSNVIAEQAVMQGASAIMKPLLDSINSALAGDYTITEKEFNAIGDLQEQQLAKLDEFLEGWYSRYGDYLEVGEMSGLQRGIEGVSESTAQIIEALLNSMRFYVADSNTQLKTLVAAQIGANDANTPNPMLAQLQIIAQQTSAIYALFDSVVGTGHPRGRSGIRVFVD